MLKRIISLGLIILLIFSLCACSSDKSETEESYNQEESVFSENNENISSQEENETGSFIKECEKFYTEYDVVGYSGGLFEVSKNDGLLYGVYDYTGKEILPVKYDAIYFRELEKSKKVYIITEYEDESFLFDEEGNLIADISDNDNLLVSESVTSSDIYFCLKKENSTDIYVDNFSNFIITLPLKGYIDIVFDNYFIGVSVDGENRCEVYDKAGNLLYRSEKSVTISELIGLGTRRAYTISGSAVKIAQEIDIGQDKNYINESNIIIITKDNNISNKNYDVFTIDMNGNINELTSSNLLTQKFYYSRGEFLDKENISDDIKLYTTNGTWKYEWADTNEPIFDERYYKNIKIGKGYIFFLTNEDNQVCVVDYNGNKIADYLDGFAYNTDTEQLTFYDTEILNTYIDSYGFGFKIGNDIYFYKY